MLRDVESQAGAADDKEQHEEGLGPLLGSLHHLLGGLTDVAEDGAQHHAGEQRGEADMYPADLKMEHGQRHGQEHEGDHQGETVAVGMEMCLDPGEDGAEERAEQQGADDLDQGLDRYGHHADMAALDGLGNTHGHGEDNETYRVVQRYDGVQMISIKLS